MLREDRCSADAGSHCGSKEWKWKGTDSNGSPMCELPFPTRYPLVRGAWRDSSVIYLHHEPRVLSLLAESSEIEPLTDKGWLGLACPFTQVSSSNRSKV
jgi:hypothetical protein